MEIKAIIFDWANTLFDTDTKKEFPDTEEVLLYCKQKGYKIYIVSLVGRTTIEERRNQIENLSLRKYIDIFDVSNEREKDKMLDRLIQKLNLPKKEILLVDDRMVKGIKYGNQHDHPTVWLQKGTFANELPNSETGNPTFIIKSLSELKNII